MMCSYCMTQLQISSLKLLKSYLLQLSVSMLGYLNTQLSSYNLILSSPFHVKREKLFHFLKYGGKVIANARKYSFLCSGPYKGGWFFPVSNQYKMKLPFGYSHPNPLRVYYQIPYMLSMAAKRSHLRPILKRNFSWISTVAFTHQQTLQFLKISSISQQNRNEFQSYLFSLFCTRENLSQKFNLYNNRKNSFTVLCLLVPTSFKVCRLNPISSMGTNLVKIHIFNNIFKHFLESNDWRTRIWTCIVCSVKTRHVHVFKCNRDG